MANYSVQITRTLRFSVNRKANDVVIKRVLWIGDFGGGGGSNGGAGGTVKRKVRFRFP